MDISHFMPHGHCVSYSPSLLGLHVSSDALIAISYFSIPLGIIYFVRKKRLDHRLIPLLFSAFILSCGVTHLFTIWNWWHSDYWLSGAFKMFCAGISFLTAILIWFLMPDALKVPLADELEQMNRDLKRSNEDLEKIVADRTKSLQAANKKLQEIGERKTSFFSGVAHEIKNHLSAILSSTELLEATEDTSKEGKALTKSIIENTDSLTTIVNDLLDLGQMESGSFKIQMEPMSLDEKLSNIETIFTQKAKEKSLSFSLEKKYEPGLEIVSDKVRVRQILVNLLTNAIKYTEKGSIKLICETGEAGHGKIVRFHVQDSGPGVPDEDVERIFEIFKRSADHARIEGRGIGLSLSREIAGLLGGTLVLSETSPEGSTFTLTIVSNGVA